MGTEIYEDDAYYLTQMKEGLKTDLLTEQEKLKFIRSLKTEAPFDPDKP